MLSFVSGATLVPFTIPCLDTLRLSHTTTIISEMRATMTPYLGEAHNLMGMTNASLNLGEGFTAVGKKKKTRIHKDSSFFSTIMSSQK